MSCFTCCAISGGIGIGMGMGRSIIESDLTDQNAVAASLNGGQAVIDGNCISVYSLLYNSMLVLC